MILGFDHDFLNMTSKADNIDTLDYIKIITMHQKQLTQLKGNL
jgi:hypothetical protein